MTDERKISIPKKCPWCSTPFEPRVAGDTILCSRCNYKLGTIKQKEPVAVKEEPKFVTIPYEEPINESKGSVWPYVLIGAVVLAAIGYFVFLR
jgi:DNA-directed RNA polymerase subunit RPC12/RpoP